MKNLTKNIIIAVVIVVVLYIGYVYLNPGSSSSSSSLVVQTNGIATDASGQPLAGQDIVSALMKLDRVQIDLTFFSDPGYLSLQDFSIPIDTSETPGKNDPFAPGRQPDGSRFGAERGDKPEALGDPVQNNEKINKYTKSEIEIRKISKFNLF